MKNPDKMCSIICSIVIYKNPLHELKETIHCLLATDLNIKIILVDNSPTNIYKDIVYDERIEYIFNSKNVGFGAAHNIAIKQSIQLNSTYHLVINPDISFIKGTLESILLFMEQNKEIGHLMPKIVYPNGKPQYLCKRKPTVLDLFLRGFIPQKYHSLFRSRMNKFEFKDLDLNDIIYNVPFLSGCFMFLKTEILKQSGLFDEKYFMYLEDADLTRRMLEFCHNSYYPHAEVTHIYSGLTHKHLKYKLITIRSAIYYFSKWGWIKNIL